MGNPQSRLDPTGESALPIWDPNNPIWKSSECSLNRTALDCVMCCVRGYATDYLTFHTCVARCSTLPTRDRRQDPKLNPRDWGRGVGRKREGPSRGNCWRFATCDPCPPWSTDPVHSPLPGVTPGRAVSCSCGDLIARMKLLSAVKKVTDKDDPSDGCCPPGTYAIRLYAGWLQVGWHSGCDNHFVRQCRDGRWGHKPGWNPPEYLPPDTGPSPDHFEPSSPKSIAITIIVELRA